MGIYVLYVKIGGEWVETAKIHADSLRRALRQASASLRPEHYGKPILLEREQITANDAPPNRVVRRSRRPR